MSSTLIEAKFQILDQTIRAWNRSNGHPSRPRLASSDQLRALVYTNRKELLPATTKPLVNHQDHQDHDGVVHRRRRSTKRTDETQEQKEWIDPKVERSQQILHDTWEQIETSVAGRGQNHQMAFERFKQSSLLHESTREPLDHSNRSLDTNASTASNQDLQENTAAVRLPTPRSAPTTRTRTNHADKSPPSNTPRMMTPRCQSANPETQSRKHRNWFEHSTSKPRSSRASQPPPLRTDTPTHKKPTSARTSHTIPELYLTEAERHGEPHAVDHSTTEITRMDARIDDPSFYYLELRLEHPSPLTLWRFEATFTDMTVPSHPSVTISELTVDAGNCLLFTDNEPQHHITTRFFNPLRHFAHVKRPRDLYGHAMQIHVKSIYPVQRVVIHTLVEFSIMEDNAESMPLPSSACNQPTHTAMQAPPSPSFASLKLQSTSSMQSLKRQNSRIQVGFMMPSPVQDSNGRNSPLRFVYGFDSQPCSSPTRTNALGSPLTTVEKKKAQLHQMRSTMRRKLQQEQAAFQDLVIGTKK